MKTFYIDNFLNKEHFLELSNLCIERSNRFNNLDYADGYGRYGTLFSLPKDIEKDIVTKARNLFNISDLEITYVQLVKYTIVNGSKPKLLPHTDQLPSTHIIDLCINTSLSDWGLLVKDTLFKDKPNGAICLYGSEEIHSRPEYTSNNIEDYSIQLFLNFAPPDHWFFKGDYKKALKYLKASPLMYSKIDDKITMDQK